MKFYKYQGAGNDFVMIDDRNSDFKADRNKIAQICDRNFGIGADGLILLQNHSSLDFQMVYFNSDGNQSSMCGNGGRCIVRFAQDLGIVDTRAEFMAIDGAHEALITQNVIELKMCNVESVQKFDSHLFLNTGSPHHVEFVQQVDKVDVKNKGAEIRYGSAYFNEGSNVNFVEVLSDGFLKIRTYERGVEDETLACGTGVTAAAIAAYETEKVNINEIKVQTLGGILKVRFEKNSSDGYENIWLCGPAEFVFEGEINI